MCYMRTFDEIIKKIQRHQKLPLDFTPEVLVMYLPSDRLKDVGYELKPDETWEASPLTEEFVTDEMKKYMDTYGWDKAENHRGISASRTIQKMEAWLWLLGRDDILKEVANTPYENYGAPKLKVIAEAMGWPVPDSAILQAMMKGEKCPGCASGNMSGCGE